MQLRIQRPDVCFEKSFLAAFSEFESEAERLDWMYLGKNSQVDLPHKDFPKFVTTLLDREHTAPADFVTTVTFWGVIGNEVVGRIGLRHYLNDFLRSVGGHIGYIVRPSFRRRGVASRMLKLVLESKEAFNIGRLLLTCDTDNPASEKVIVRNGGAFESVVDHPPFKPKKRFWIDVLEASEAQ